MNHTSLQTTFPLVKSSTNWNYHNLKVVKQVEDVSPFPSPNILSTIVCKWINDNGIQFP